MMLLCPPVFLLAGLSLRERRTAAAIDGGRTCPNVIVGRLTEVRFGSGIFVQLSLSGECRIRGLLSLRAQNAA